MLHNDVRRTANVIPSLFYVIVFIFVAMLDFFPYFQLKLLSYRWFTWYCTHFLKIGLVAGGRFYSYFINQGNKSDKERKIVRKKLSCMHTKRFNTFFKRWVQFRVGAIPGHTLIKIEEYYKFNIRI